MNTKLRYLNAQHLDWLDKYTYKIRRLEDFICGYASLINIKTVKKKAYFEQNGKRIAYGSNGYRWLIFLPEDDNWCMTGVYDDKDEIIEWYFDITRQNFFDGSIPYYEDLYLDVVLNPKTGIKVLDEDELLDALNNGLITRSDFDMAHRVCKHLIDDIIINKNNIELFSERCLAALK